MRWLPWLGLTWLRQTLLCYPQVNRSVMKNSRERITCIFEAAINSCKASMQVSSMGISVSSWHCEHTMTHTAPVIQPAQQVARSNLMVQEPQPPLANLDFRPGQCEDIQGMELQTWQCSLDTTVLCPTDKRQAQAYTPFKHKVHNDCISVVLKSWQYWRDTGHNLCKH